MENRIKECQLGLFAGRTSCHLWWPNQCRLLLASLAYVLMEPLRNVGLVGTEWAVMVARGVSTPRSAGLVALFAMTGLRHVRVTRTGDKAFRFETFHRPVHGMMGTAEIAFIGDPSSTRLLMAT